MYARRKIWRYLRSEKRFVTSWHSIIGYIGYLATGAYGLHLNIHADTNIHGVFGAPRSDPVRQRLAAAQ
jgi:hypothetical protein